MDLNADLGTMLGDWDTIALGGETYPGVFNPEEYALPDGADRVPMFLMRYSDWVASGAAIEGDARIGDTTYQVRGLKRSDDGKTVVLTLAT